MVLFGGILIFADNALRSAYDLTTGKIIGDVPISQALCWRATVFAYTDKGAAKEQHEIFQTVLIQKTRL